MKQKVILSIFFLLSVAKLFAQSPCVGLQTDSVSPLPDSGKYLPGTVVTFCYTLDSYSSTGDWLHGFVLKFGPGWDTTTFTPLNAPSSCDGFADWGFYDSCKGGKGRIFGQGFYSDRSQQIGLHGDGIPGNNLGDDNIVNCSWSFCFSIKVKDTALNGTLYAYVTPISDSVLEGDTLPHCVNAPYPLLPLNTSGIKDIGMPNSSISIYPNPVADMLTVDLSDWQNAKKLLVVNLLGEEIYYSVEKSKTALINVSSFNDGIYFLIIKNGNSVLQRRFIVQH